MGLVVVFCFVCVPLPPFSECTYVRVCVPLPYFLCVCVRACVMLSSFNVRVCLLPVLFLRVCVRGACRCLLFCVCAIASFF